MCLAVPGRVAALEDAAGVRMARVDFGGVERRVCLETLPGAVPGDWILVHAGFALQIVDAEAAEDVVRWARGDEGGRLSVRYVDEFRDPDSVRRAAARVTARASRRWTLMEVCGGQTHALLASGLDELLEEAVELLHGPGCPVCVTPASTLDRAVRLSELPGVVLCSFGDMLRVPGSRGDLLGARARGADVRVVYSPLDAVELAARLPEQRVVFLGVGFETTAPAVAGAARAARSRGLDNFFLLVSQVRVPPALEAILSAPDNRVQAFLAAGHVCTVMGTGEYGPLVRRFRVPVVATGFEPLDLVQGVAMAVEQLERGEARLEIQYRRAVREQGNPAARALLEDVFEVGDQEWRGMGTVSAGGLVLREAWADLDASRWLEAEPASPAAASRCRAGDVLRGVLRPPDCPWFGRDCTPEAPLGAPMVSAEGACAAYFQYRLAGPGSEESSDRPGGPRA